MAAGAVPAADTLAREAGVAEAEVREVFVSARHVERRFLTGKECLVLKCGVPIVALHWSGSNPGKIY